MEDALRGMPLLVVLLGAQDPGNVGTIVRSAEAFGATGVAVCSTGTLGTANPLSSKAIRLGPPAPLCVCQLSAANHPLEDLLAQLRASGVKSYAAVPDFGKPDVGTSDAAPAVLCPGKWIGRYRRRLCGLEMKGQVCRKQSCARQTRE